MQTFRYSVIICMAVVTAFSSCGQSNGTNRETNNEVSQQNEPPSCDCCVFDEVKNRRLTHKTQITPDTVIGERMKITGVLYKPDGRTPAANVKMYFYHTNNNGRYGKLGTEDRSSHAWWHGYCRGWLQTNDKGEYEINTIKPVLYPEGGEPAHIHSSVLNADKTCQNLVDFVFKGDQFLTKRYWDNTRRYFKSIGIKDDPEYEGVVLAKNASGLLEGKRDIVLQK